MRVITYEGREIPLVGDPDEWDAGEIDDVERGLGVRMSGMGGGRTAAAMVAISVHRADPGFDIATNVGKIKPMGYLRTAREIPDPDAAAAAPEAEAHPHGQVVSPGYAGASKSAAKPRKAPADRKTATKAASRRRSPGSTAGA